MTAELDKGAVVRLTLGGSIQNRTVLEHLLRESESVKGFAIDEQGVLTAFVEPGHGELDLVRALAAAGMFPQETFAPRAGIERGPHVC